MKKIASSKPKRKEIAGLNGMSVNNLMRQASQLGYIAPIERLDKSQEISPLLQKIGSNRKLPRSTARRLRSLPAALNCPPRSTARRAQLPAALNCPQLPAALNCPPRSTARRAQLPAALNCPPRSTARRAQLPVRQTGQTFCFGIPSSFPETARGVEAQKNADIFRQIFQRRDSADLGNFPARFVVDKRKISEFCLNHTWRTVCNVHRCLKTPRANQGGSGLGLHNSRC